jgi:hypothetical protein
MLSTKNSPDIISGLNHNLNLEFKMGDKKVTITVARPFRYEGERFEVGETLEVNKHFAGEMIAANKAKLGRVKIEPPKSKKAEKETAKVT